jgi:hypothetical protein
VGLRETALSLLAVCAITPAVAQAAPERLAVASFDFLDTSFEATDRTAEHAARIEAFDGWLRDGLEDPRVELIALACPQRCTGSAPASRRWLRRRRRPGPAICWSDRCARSAR